MDYETFEFLREKKNVRNADIARAIAISPVVFSEWKKGKSVPKHEKMVKIANYFGVDEDYSIWNQIDDKESSESHKNYLKQHFVTEEEFIVIDNYRKLDYEDRIRVLERIGALLDDPKYKKEPVEGGEVG